MISLRELRKTYASHAAVDGISLEVREGETLVLLGTSGCGKTTTLRMINRLVEPTSGSIHIGRRDIAQEDPVALRRQIGYIIQGIGLFPHRSVEENILTVPRLLGWPRARCRQRLEELLAWVGLPEALLGRHPEALSGGQQQRVGLARALAADPPIVLMDEPFGALDPITRRQVRGEFRQLESLRGKTVVLVTHDIAEALEMGDRVCLMSEGRVVQIGTPGELLFRPCNTFVRAFFEGGRLQHEWMALTLADLPGLAPRGLPPRTTLAHALALWEAEDAAAFLDGVQAFLDYKARGETS